LLATCLCHGFDLSDIRSCVILMKLDGLEAMESLDELKDRLNLREGNMILGDPFVAGHLFSIFLLLLLFHFSRFCLNFYFFFAVACIRRFILSSLGLVMMAICNFN